MFRVICRVIVMDETVVKTYQSEVEIDSFGSSMRGGGYADPATGSQAGSASVKYILLYPLLNNGIAPGGGYLCPLPFKPVANIVSSSV